MTDSWQSAVAGHRSSTRERIFAAAMALLAEHGMAGATMTAIADRAGVSRPTLYKHFPDVDHIVAALAEEEFAAFRAQLDAQMDPAWSTRRKLQYLVDAHLRQYHDEVKRMGAGSFESGVSPVVRATVERELADHHRRIVAILADGVAAGELASHLDVELHAEFIQHVLGGLRRTLRRTETSAEAVGRAVTEFVLSGVEQQDRSSP